MLLKARFLGLITSGQFWPVWLNLNQDENLDFMIVKSHDWNNGNPGDITGVDISAIKFIADPKFTNRHVRIISTDDGNRYEICNTKYFQSGEDYCEITPDITLRRDRSYIFTMAYSDYETHPFKISDTKDGTHGGGVEYTSRVLAFDDGETISFTITVPENAPDKLYYYCEVL